MRSLQVWTTAHYPTLPAYMQHLSHASCCSLAGAGPGELPIHKIDAAGADVAGNRMFPVEHIGVGEAPAMKAAQGLDDGHFNACGHNRNNA